MIMKQTATEIKIMFETEDSDYIKNYAKTKLMSLWEDIYVAREIEKVKQ